MSRYYRKVRLRAQDFLKIGAGSILLTLVIVGLCLGLLLFCYYSFLGGLGSNDVVNTASSPDGYYQAVAFIRCEGAWGGCTPEVSILKPGRLFLNTDIGNIFIGSESESFIDIQWASERTLIIRYTVHDDNQPSLQLKQNGDITVEYQLVESEQP